MPSVDYIFSERPLQDKRIFSFDFAHANPKSA
jgi:hypothetical protein